MENQNPLESLRDAVLESQLLGIDNGIAQLGVSDDIIKICNALDIYYGIKRETKVHYPSDNEYTSSEMIKIFNNSNLSNIYGNFANNRQYHYNEYNFYKTRELVKMTKEPLQSIKSELTKENPFYLYVSSIIVSIAIRDVINSVDSYKPNGNHICPFSGIDMDFSNLVSGALKVFNDIYSFDMSKDCYDNYEANRKELQLWNEKLYKAMTRPTKKETSGCMMLACAISTSLITCGILIMMII